MNKRTAERLGRAFVFLAVGVPLFFYCWMAADWIWWSWGGEGPLPAVVSIPGALVLASWAAAVVAGWARQSAASPRAMLPILGLAVISILHLAARVEGPQVVAGLSPGMVFLDGSKLESEVDRELLSSASIGAVVGILDATSTVPDGWIPCDGTSVSREEFPALYALLGQTVETLSAEGQFRLPELDPLSGMWPEEDGLAVWLFPSDHQDVQSFPRSQVNWFVKAR